MSVTPGALAAVIAAAVMVPSAGSAPDRPTPSASALAGLAQAAASGQGAAADHAVAQLREAGPAGLAALLAAEPRGPRWSAAVDAVAAQKDAAATGLYWYTDLERAKAAARAGGRPILSLHLLGRLDREASCANSRFFRTVLYANEDVGRALRERFVLHWESVRPVPRVTIDLGDGRRLAGTVAGNSIHYVLDSEGRVVDGLPGLYGPQAFLRVLGEAEHTARAASGLDGPGFSLYRAAHHRLALAAMGADGIEVPRLALPVSAPGRRPSADQAGRLARTKALAEVPLLRGLSRSPADAAALGEAAGAERAAAARFAAECRLDARSRAIVVAKQRSWARAAGVAAPDEAAIVAGVERSLAADTARNETVLRPRLRAWFARGEAPATASALDDRVYAELFLTPASDPWLGLVDPTAFAALDPLAVQQQQLAAPRP